MPIKKNDNAAFIALPVTSDKVLAETPCAMCGTVAKVKIRRDGWVEIQCSENVDCRYSEGAYGKGSLKSLVNAVLKNPKTVFRRANKAQVMAALGLAPEPQADPQEPVPVQAPKPQNEPQEPAPVQAPEPQKTEAKQSLDPKEPASAKAPEPEIELESEFDLMEGE